MEKVKPTNAKGSASKPKETAKSAVPAAPIKVPPMCRPIDWLTLAITFGIVWAVYLFTLAPEQTLEDSGELCTASYYAGIPHPPGYPFWSLYSWLWTVIVPFGNVAWRVEVGQSFAAAMGCGLLALMVSRGSSMLIEGLEELKIVTRQWENAICVVSGFVAGTLLGFDVFMWSESVVINRISVFGVPWLIAVMACLMRWIYAPQQRRYLYLAMFIYGICATIHQTLLLSAMGVEIAVALALPRLGRDLFLTNSLIYIIGLLVMSTGKVPALNNMSSIEGALFHIVGVGSIVAGGWLAMNLKKIYSEWKTVIWMGVMWALGVSFYFYMPLSGMTDPPMQWGYPRTVEGFFHALSRGQYESTHGTNIFSNPKHFVFQLWYIVEGLSESFSWVYVFVGVLPFFFLKKMLKRERSWILGLVSIFFCLSVLLVILLDVSPDRSSSDLNKVFFTASHALFALMIGYGLTLLAAYAATHYQKFRRWGLLGGTVAVVLAVYCLVDAAGKLYFGPAGQISLSQLPHYIAQAFDKDQYGLPVFANLILVAIPLVFIAALLAYRKRGPVLILLVLFAIMPVYSGMSHWYKSEQRNHWFGYWFGHDMFTPAFTDPKTGKLSYDNTLRAELLKNPANAKLIYPEMARNTILFGGTDPGRFCPTYAIFCDSLIPHNCQPEQDQKFDRRDCYLITQNALADGTYLDYLRAQYNRSKQIDPPFFSRLFKYIAAIGGLTSPGTIVTVGGDLGSGDSGSGLIEGTASLLYNILDRPFTAWGQHVETRRRAEGVYPPSEIYIPSPADSQKCFQDYTDDVARRQQLGQLKPGENVNVDNGRVQVSGQVAVMMINGLLCKVIFDNNPTNEFYVEESFPLDWMYPYETPFGIIMKINRNTQAELSDDVFQLDHQFWTKFSARLCGNWITYDTSVKEIADFCERTYIRNNYKDFTGDRRFVRDDDAQKAFSKLRSSQAGIYAWRCALPNSGTVICPPEFRQKSAAAQNALIRETDFAFKQAFAFCPYSPEAVYRYIINFLLPLGRFDDAVIIAETCKKLDPYNDSISNLVEQLKQYKKQNAERSQTVSQIDQMENMARTNPANFQNLITLGGTYLQLQQTNRAVELLDQAFASPNLKFQETAAIAQYYAQLSSFGKLETALKRLVALAPDRPEPLYDLSAFQAITGQTPLALQNLKIALNMNTKRLATNPSATDLLTAARTDQRFNALRALPEFQKLVPSQ
jgi:tetratricopeptide (TPR) repeat protein